MANPALPSAMQALRVWDDRMPQRVFKCSLSTQAGMYRRNEVFKLVLKHASLPFASVMRLKRADKEMCQFVNASTSKPCGRILRQPRRFPLLFAQAEDAGFGVHFRIYSVSFAQASVYARLADDNPARWFECPVCMDTCFAPTQSSRRAPCKNAAKHASICHKCIVRVSRCPMCREPFDDAPLRVRLPAALEGLAERRRALAYVIRSRSSE